jgi:hypothetical protein
MWGEQCIGAWLFASRSHGCSVKFLRDLATGGNSHHKIEKRHDTDTGCDRFSATDLKPPPDKIGSIGSDLHNLGSSREFIAYFLRTPTDRASVKGTGQLATLRFVVAVNATYMN